MHTYETITKNGAREWHADDADHAREQHVDAFGTDDPREAIIAVQSAPRLFDSLAEAREELLVGQLDPLRPHRVPPRQPVKLLGIDERPVEVPQHPFFRVHPRYP